MAEWTVDDRRNFMRDMLGVKPNTAIGQVDANRRRIEASVQEGQDAPAVKKPQNFQSAEQSMALLADELKAGTFSVGAISDVRKQLDELDALHAKQAAFAKDNPPKK